MSCHSAPMSWTYLGADHRQPPDQRDHAGDSRGYGPPRVAVHRHGNRHLLQPGRREDLDAHAGWPACESRSYDLKIKDDDLVAGTHGRSFWILDDIAPLRALADGGAASRLRSPRARPSAQSCISARWPACGEPVAFAITYGIGGGIATHELPDGTRRREHLDVGENPPNGAIIYYWLGDDADTVYVAATRYKLADYRPHLFRTDDVSEPVALTVHDSRGAVVITLRSDGSCRCSGWSFPLPARQSWRRSRRSGRR